MFRLPMVKQHAKKGRHSFSALYADGEVSDNEPLLVGSEDRDTHHGTTAIPTTGRPRYLPRDDRYSSRSASVGGMRLILRAGI